MNALEVTEKVQDGMLKAIETTQGWTLGALQSTSSAFDTFRPDPAKIPFADQLPTPAETVDTTFSFAGRLLEAQHSFLLGLAEMSMPTKTTTVTKKA
ncbi:MAG TPA: hypothetical protein VHU17_09065 [Acidimicrobiales bacterium]|jgi:hypothetical protein|nr:hypothetical protein [Acidimicrobiales bacterium]